MVKKTRANLGIAIEGGADTKQRLPRVINIAANGAAFEAGGLRVGQLILAVDGQFLEGKNFVLNTFASKNFLEGKNLVLNTLMFFGSY